VHCGLCWIFHGFLDKVLLDVSMVKLTFLRLVWIVEVKILGVNSLECTCFKKCGNSFYHNPKRVFLDDKLTPHQFSNFASKSSFVATSNPLD